MPESEQEPRPLPDPIRVAIRPVAEVAQPDADKPLAEGAFLKVELDEEQRKQLAKELLHQIDDMLEARAPIEERIKLYRSQYSQLLEESGFPFPGAYHLNVPLTVNKLDTAMAESQEVFEQADPKWTVQGVPNEGLKELVTLQQDVLDAYEDLVEGAFVSPRTFFDAWLLGNGWEARVFKRHVVRSLQQRTWRTLAEFVEEFPDQHQDYPEIEAKLKAGESVTRVLEIAQDMVNAPVSEHVEWEDAVVPLEAAGNPGLREAALLARRVWMWPNQIDELEREGDYLEGTGEELRYRAQPLEKLGQVRELNPDYGKEPIETFECIYFMRVAVPGAMPGDDGQYAKGDTMLARCLINVARDHALVMRAIRYPYDHQRPYLITHCVQETQKGIYQPGLGEKLQQINLSANALLSHILNAGLIATSVSFKVRSATDAARAMHEKEWFPGCVTELSNLDDAQQWQFQLPNLDFMVKMLGMMLSMADDVTGVTANLGGDVDPSDPSAPGNKTAMLLRRASKKLRRYISTLRKSVDESGYQALRLIAQYVPAEKVAEIVGKPVDQVRAMLRARMPTVTHAAAFDTDRFEQQAADKVYAEIVFKDPLLAQDPRLRIRLYKMLAETDTHGWRERLETLFPEEELEAFAPQEPSGPGKAEAVHQSLMEKAVQAGKTPEEAQVIADRAVETMVAQAGGGA